MSDKIKWYFHEYFNSSVWTGLKKAYRISDLEDAYRAGFNKGKSAGYSTAYDEGFDHGSEQSLGLDA